MRVDVLYRKYKEGAIWLERGGIGYSANWFGKGPIRKRAILKAKMLQTVVFARAVALGVR